MNNLAQNEKYTDSAIRPDDPDPYPDKRVGEYLTDVVSNDWVNAEYKLMVLKTHEKALSAYAGQFFHLLCPTPDGAEVWMRRPMSVYKVDKAAGQLEFLYKCEGRGTKGMATLTAGDTFNVSGPLGVGFHLDPTWKNIVVLGRGVGLATLAPLSQLASENGVGITAILSARKADLVMSEDLFQELGARTVTVVDTDGSSDVGNVSEILEELVGDGKADAFFTCGSSRLLKLMQNVGKKYSVPGQVAMEQIMVCGVGACYVCMRTFEINGERTLKRVCREGPVFNIQEAVGW
ncbi:MAG: Dihydroorotate dehydrogenase B (NAD(+)), electron transfer subunit [Alphaproteobacteria bacterium MarineAlpha11_Bin1]|nr:MAG: Dihydroorotate dehydrogenase B (NAD(+)), electron transfer subunit [Alphaproteobacteria bacterium MarineAlpha11_Bin1]|tara:strand:- start:13410 stop:14282 length:873 start_codon:yes stop_codon:yes gene_type:complete